MKLALIGLSHRTAPVEVRERLAFDGADLGDALRSLTACEGVSEALILSTCNRVEVLTNASDEGSVREFLSAYHRVPLDAITNHLYSLHGTDVVRHVFRVAASLDSMVVGEPQILGQIKDAYRLATAAGTVGPHIGPVMDRAFLVAKKVRSQTGIAQSAVSVSFAAVELARRIFGDLAGKTVMIIGASKMGELAAKHLRNAGVSKVIVTNRTFSRAVELAQLFDGAAVGFEHLNDHIQDADIVISSTGAPHFVITKPNAERIIRRRKNAPMFLIDIAVPRDIDPAVNEIDNVFLYDIDDLQQTVEDNLRERRGEAVRAEEIIDAAVDQFCSAVENRDVVPTIVALQEALEKLRRQEIERNRKLLGPLSDQQRDALDRITQSMIRKVLHHPIAELKAVRGRPDGPELVELIRRIFNAQDSSGGQDE